MNIIKICPPLHITQHKRFVPYGTHPNPALIFDGAKLVEGLNHKED